MAQLLEGTERGVVSAPSLAVSVAMPAAEMLRGSAGVRLAAEAQSTVEVSRIFADALGGGDAPVDIAAVLHGLTGEIAPAHGFDTQSSFSHFAHAFEIISVEALGFPGEAVASKPPVTVAIPRR